MKLELLSICCMSDLFRVNLCLQWLSGVLVYICACFLTIFLISRFETEISRLFQNLGISRFWSFRGWKVCNDMDFTRIPDFPDIFHIMEIYNYYGKLKSIPFPIKVRTNFILLIFIIFCCHHFFPRILHLLLLPFHIYLFHHSFSPFHFFPPFAIRAFLYISFLSFSLYLICFIPSAFVLCPILTFLYLLLSTPSNISLFSPL